MSDKIETPGHTIIVSVTILGMPPSRRVTIQGPCLNKLLGLLARFLGFLQLD
jgi:hypothetical protein